MSDPNAQTKKRQGWLIGGAVAGIFVLAGAGMFLFDSGSSTGPKREKLKTVSITAPGTVDDKDAWRAQQSAEEKANKTQIGEVRSQLKTQADENKKLALALEELKAAKRADAAGLSGKGDSSVLDMPLPQGNAGQQVLQSPVGKGVPQQASPLNQPLTPVAVPPRRELEIIQFGKAPGGNKAGEGMLASAAGGLTEVLGFPTDEKAKKYGTTSGGSGGGKRDPIQFLPAGTFVRVAMLNGVDAPTGGQAQTNPLAVAFHVLDTANLANKHRLDIKDCRFIASAWGDLSSERMMGRTESLTCIINDETVEMAVKGQVNGEDGKAGVRGRLVTKQGQVLANALFAGALSGIGKAFQASAATTTTGGGGVTQSINPDMVGQAALGGGVGSAGQTLAQYYLKAADKLFPVIETDGGRVVEILITKGAVYNGKASLKDDYRGMLKRSGTNTRRNEDD